jgi:hypothetical protein
MRKGNINTSKRADSIEAPNDSLTRHLFICRACVKKIDSFGPYFIEGQTLLNTRCGRFDFFALLRRYGSSMGLNSNEKGSSHKAVTNNVRAVLNV